MEKLQVLKNILNVAIADIVTDRDNGIFTSLENW